MTRTLVIGMGEVGTALAEVLQSAHEVTTCDIIQVETWPQAPFSVVHMCIPYSKEFLGWTEQYAADYSPDALIVHSTVPVGTTRQLGPRAVHSPVHGVHPALAEGIRTFTKYVGGANPGVVALAVEHLSAAGIPAHPVSSPEASEASKLWCTTRYGLEIAIAKEIKRYCDRRGLDFAEVYGWAEHYNAGYRTLGKPDVARSILAPVPGPAGGHCILNNARLLDDDLGTLLLDLNEKYRDEVP